MAGRKTAESPATALHHRVRGVLLLAAMALLGYGLSHLKDVSGVDLEAQSLPGPDGQSIILAIEKGRGAGAWPFDPGVRLVLSRIPVQFDAARSLVQLPGRGPAIVPRGWSTVLIDSRGRIDSSRLELEPRQAEPLLRLGFEEARKRLSALDPGAAAFWSR